MSFGDQLTNLRNERGLTRVKLAEDLHIPMTTLRNYEQNTREPGHKFVVQVAQYFGVTTDYILENEKISPAPEDTEEIPIEDSMKLFDALVAAGIIHDDVYTPEDIEFLGYVCGIVGSWFARKEQKKLVGKSRVPLTVEHPVE